jgi:hypothetical protein
MDISQEADKPACGTEDRLFIASPKAPSDHLAHYSRWRNGRHRWNDLRTMAARRSGFLPTLRRGVYGGVDRLPTPSRPAMNPDTHRYCGPSTPRASRGATHPAGPNEL